MSDILSNDELAYHKRVIQSMQSAQAISQAWSQHLWQKYALRQGDHITDDGQIVRQNVPPPPDAPAQ